MRVFNSIFFLFIVTLFVFPGKKLGAVDRIKANNATNLNSGASWLVAVPVNVDVAVWDSTVVGPNSVALGANLNWLGIRIANPGGTVTITPGNTLTLGFSGIDMSAATQDLTIQSGLNLLAAAGQTWTVAAGRTLTVSGPFLRSPGSTLNVIGPGTVTVTGLATDPTGIIGPWLTFGTGTAAQYATLISGNITGFTGTAAPSAAGVTDTTGLVNYDVAAVGTLGPGASFNTLRYTGAAGTIAGNFTANGILTAGTGALTMSGDIVIGASREFVVTNGDGNALRALTLSGIISDNASGSSGLNKAGLGNLTLSGASSYTGVTTISRGRIVVSNNGGLGSTSGGTRLGLSGGITLNGGLTLAESFYFDDIVNTGITKMDGSGTNTLTGAIRVSSSTRWQSGMTVLNVSGGISTTGGAAGSFLVMQAANTMNITGKGISNGTGQLYMDNAGRTIVLGVVGSTYGSHALYAGTLQTNVANALSTSATISFSTTYATSAAILNLNGFDQIVGGIATQVFGSFGAYDRVITSATAATLSVGANNTSTTFDGRFADAVSLTKIGTGTLTLTGASTTTGNFTVNAGTVNLNFARANVAVSGAGSVSNHLPSGAPLTLGGGTFQLTGRNNGTATTLANGSWAVASPQIITVTSTAGLAPGQLVSHASLPAGSYVVSVLSGTQFVINTTITTAATGAAITVTPNSTTTSQSFSGLVLNPGNSGVTVTIPANGSDGTVLNLGAITQNAGSTVAFTLPTGTQSSTNGIVTTRANLNDILGAWARVGNDWAANNGTNNVVAFTGYTDVTRLDPGPPPKITSNPSSNVRIIEGTGIFLGNITPLTAGTTDINTLLQTATGGTTTYDPGTTDILRLGAQGGIMMGSAASLLNIGASVNDGFLTAGGADNTAGAIYLTNNHVSNVLTINSAITNNGTGEVSLTTSGAGIITLAGTNTYTGKTYIGGSGRLQISSESNLGVTPGSAVADQLTLAGGTLRNTSAVTLSANRGITLTAGTTSFLDTQATLTVNGVITGSGNLTKPGQSGAGHLELNAANIHTGITLNQATGNASELRLGHTHALQFSTLDTGGVNNQSVTFSVAGTNTYHLGGLQGADSIALGANTISVGANHSTTIYTGVISGTGGLTKVGNGTLNLTGASTYSGDTRVEGGMLVLANANAIQNSTLDTGPAGSQSVNLTLPEGTTYNIGGLKGSANLDLAVSHLSVGSNNQSTTFDGVIQGPFNNNLTKVGTGELTLTGANTYTGNTTVSAGILAADNTSGSATGMGNVTVQANATLEGTGSIYGSTAVLNDGTITGGSVGTVGELSFERGLTMASGSIWLVDLVQNVNGNSDNVVVGGNLSITSGAELAFDFGGSTFTNGNSYTIAEYGSLSGEFNLSGGGLWTDGTEQSLGGGLYRINYGTFTPGAITLTAVPEPGSLALLGLVLGGYFWRRVRRRRG